MTTWIALLRGVNVGGHNKLPMADLKALAAELGFADPRTYIQSGNLVFEADPGDPDRLGAQLGAAIEARFGVRAPVFVLSRQELEAAIAGNPFPEAEAEPARLHMAFLTAPADPDAATLDALAAPDERWALVDRVFYLHAPSGIGRSKLAAKLERLLDVETTARNLRTVVAVAGLAGQS